MISNSFENFDGSSVTIENNILKGDKASFDSKYSHLGKLLLDTLDNHPNVIGQVDAVTGKEDSFLSMRDRIVKCALWLRKEGIKSDDVVGVCAKNHFDSFVPCIAALCAGALFNPWDPDLNTSTARYFLKLSEPKVLFTDEKSAEIILDAARSENYNLKMIIFGKYHGQTSFSEILEGHGKEEIRNFSCTDIKDVHETAVILYSSGTTGMPKGVEVSHFSLLSTLTWTKALSLETQVPLWFSTLYWISGIILSLQSIISCTRRIVCADFDEEFACRVIEKYKVTWTLFSSSMANRLLKSGFIPKYDLSSLRVMFIGGAVFTQESQNELKQLLPRTKVLQGYGMTEIGGVAAVQKSNAKFGSCGFPGTNVEIKVVDIETGQALGPNQKGEIYIKSPTITRGYYKNPQATKDTIDFEGWLHSGDLGYYDEEGELFVIDRLKETIKYRSRQISPVEIENVIQAHPAVLEVAVIGVPHILDDEHPVAFVSKIPNKEVTEQELIDLVAKNLMDHHKLRAGVQFMDALPHTPTGKISRKELKIIAKALLQVPST